METEKKLEWPRTAEEAEAMIQEIATQGHFEDCDDFRSQFATAILHFPQDRERPPNDYFITKIAKTMANAVFYAVGVGCDERRRAKEKAAEDEKKTELTLIQGEANASGGEAPVQGA